MLHDEEQEDGEMCAVCLQKLHHPAQLPCGHIFCFLCVKGVAFQNRKCAMCRSDIPPDYLDHPVLLEQLSPDQELNEPQPENQWYYEGRNGWWKYDERSNVELETKFNNNEDECMLLLAGALYSVDFSTMTQVRCSDQTRRRRVKRDTPSFPSKGIAGIKMNNTQIEQTKTENDNNSSSNQNEVEVIEIGDDDDDDNVQIIEPEDEEIVQIFDEDSETDNGTGDLDGGTDDVTDLIGRLGVSTPTP